jgi:hypothetical protein
MIGSPTNLVVHQRRDARVGRQRQRVHGHTGSVPEVETHLLHALLLHHDDKMLDAMMRDDMRTTVTLDPDVQALVETAMRERGINFKQAINDAIRAGLAPPKRAKFKQRSFNTGVYPDVDYDKVAHLVAALEDEEIIRKMKLGK